MGTAFACLWMFSEGKRSMPSTTPEPEQSTDFQPVHAHQVCGRTAKVVVHDNNMAEPTVMGGVHHREANRGWPCTRGVHPCHTEGGFKVEHRRRSATRPEQHHRSCCVTDEVGHSPQATVVERYIVTCVRQHDRRPHRHRRGKPCVLKQAAHPEHVTSYQPPTCWRVTPEGTVDASKTMVEHVTHQPRAPHVPLRSVCEQIVPPST